MKKALKIILGFVGIVTLGGILAYNFMNANLNRLAKRTIEDVDLTRISDGSYQGSYDSFPIRVEVTVTIADHAYRSITIDKHVTGQGQAAEGLPEIILEKQSLEVDSISGATYSSKAILMAIVDALESDKE